VSRRIDRHGRVTDSAIILFKTAIRLEHEGLPTDSEQYVQLSMELHKEVGRRPLDVNVLNVQIGSLPDRPMDRSFKRAVSLRRELVLANH
jgi:hypothetical protein